MVRDRIKDAPDAVIMQDHRSLDGIDFTRKFANIFCVRCNSQTGFPRHLIVTCFSGSTFSKFTATAPLATFVCSDGNMPLINGIAVAITAAPPATVAAVVNSLRFDLSISPVVISSITLCLNQA